jgi:hypothetical protein
MQQQARRFACDHDQVIVTIPRALQDWGLAQVAAMTTLLCARGHDPVRELLGDPTALGAPPGILATWHTWPQTRRLHPPSHARVTGGGLTHTGHWVAVHHGFVLPSRVVMALCRGKLLAAIRRAVCQGQLPLPAGMRPQRGEHLLNQLGRAQWHVPIRERSPPGAGVLTSLARYVRGGPLANRRVGSCARGEVTCRYRVNGEAADRPQSGLMTWSVAECSGRYRRHVPAPGTRVVRAYGLSAPTTGEALPGTRAQRGQGPVAAPVVLDGQTACSQRGAAHLERGPVGGQRLVCRGMIPRPRMAPSARAPAAVAA